MESKYNSVISWIENNRNEVIGFLQDMVRIPSINPWFTNYKEYTTEEEVQKFCADNLKNMGCEVDLWEIDTENLKQFEGMPGYYEGRPMKNRPNLLARLKGNGNGKSLLFTGHCDVVEVGLGWTKDPFGAEIENGKIYGRGIVDMKGGLAAAIMAVKAIQSCGIKLKGDVLIGIVPDEEAGGMGSLDFVHSGHFDRADGAIMAEPTEGIGAMCRGILWGKIIIPGKAGHIEMSLKHWQDDGIVDAVKLMRLYLAQIDVFNMHWAAKKRHPLLPDLPCQILVAQVNAGEYPSTYAGYAEIVFNAQYLPSELDDKYRGSAVKKEIEDFVAAVAATDEWLRENPPRVEWLLDADCAETPPNSDFVQSVLHSVNKLDSNIKVCGVGCHTDMGWLCRTGTPTVNFGPGNPRLSHQADEYMEVEEYINYVKMYATIIMDWCGVSE